MRKNVQTTIELFSLHMLARLCSEFFKLGFNSMWTKKFQVFKLDLENAEGHSTFVGSWRKQGSSRKTSTSATVTVLKPLCGSQQNEENWSSRPAYLSPEKSVCSSEARVRASYGTTDWFKIGKDAWQGYRLSPWIFNLYVEYIMWNSGLDESQAGIMIIRRISTFSDMQMISF